MSLNLKPLRFEDIEGWAADDHAAAFSAFVRSCHADPELPHAGAAIALGERFDCAAARDFFESRFTPRVIADSEAGFVTGYYEPELEGSYVQTETFRIPVCRRPPDLITLVPDAERARFIDRITGLRATPDGNVPYYTRAEIWAGALEGRGLELLYVSDMVELFYMQVQGSGLVHLNEGGTVRLTYDGKNGHPYTLIGALLVQRGKIAPEAMSMAAVKTWLRADQGRGRALMEENRSYVFFRTLDEHAACGGPRGAHGATLTPRRSLAVDTQYHRLGTPVFVTADQLATEHGEPFYRLMIAQDVGSAIAGPERGDIFWGMGEAAGEIAGSTRHSARFFVLLPKR